MGVGMCKIMFLGDSCY